MKLLTEWVLASSAAFCALVSTLGHKGILTREEVLAVLKPLRIFTEQVASFEGRFALSQNVENGEKQ